MEEKKSVYIDRETTMLVDMRAEVKMRNDIFLSKRDNRFGAYCENELYIIVGSKMAMYGINSVGFNKMLFDTIIEDAESRGLWTKLSNDEYETKKQAELKRLRDAADLKQWQADLKHIKRNGDAMWYKD